MTEMIEHEGIVRSVTNGMAVISVQTDGCGGCGHRSGCSMGRLAGGARRAEMTLAVGENVQPGSRVVLSLPLGRARLAGLVAYLVPSLALMVGAGIGNAGFGSDGATAIGALIGLLSGLLAGRIMPAWMPLPTVLPAGYAGSGIAKERGHEIQILRDSR